MHGIGLDGFRQIAPDRPRRRLGRIGRAHDLAIAGHGILALEDLNDDGSAGHEGAEIVVERPRLMHLVELLRLRAREPQPLLGDDAQPGLLQAGIDLTGQVAPGRIRLDDR